MDGPDMENRSCFAKAAVAFGRGLEQTSRTVLARSLTMTRKTFSIPVDRIALVWAVRGMAIGIMVTWPLDVLEGMVGMPSATHPAVVFLNILVSAIAVVGAMFVTERANRRVAETNWVPQ